MTQGEFARRIRSTASVHSYFGIASIVLGVVDLAAQIEGAWGACLVPGLDCSSLPIITIGTILGKLVWGLSLGWLLFCNVIPIIGVIISIVGFVVDRKKIFSILGLALVLVSLIIGFLVTFHIIFNS
jgi:uncharacterized membrane protein